MLEIVLYRDSRKHLSGFSARGHADFAEHGEDIVCAAVSAILQAARLGLEVYAGSELQALQQAGELRIDLRERERARESVQAILVTAELAVEHIAHRYPEHVRLRHERTVESEGPGG